MLFKAVAGATALQSASREMVASTRATALPNARILRLPHTGHFPHAEQPKIVFLAIETFLGGGWPKDAKGK
jgi:hypothetical protein